MAAGGMSAIGVNGTITCRMRSVPPSPMSFAAGLSAPVAWSEKSCGTRIRRNSLMRPPVALFARRNEACQWSPSVLGAHDPVRHRSRRDGAAVRAGRQDDAALVEIGSLPRRPGLDHDVVGGHA